MAKTQSKEERDKLFAEAPIGKALATMAIPTIIAQLIHLVYSMADAYFVGRTGNPYMIAAISLSTSLFLLNLPIAGLFGIGGGSYISRLLGIQQYDRVKHVSAFSIYGAIAFVALYSLSLLLFLDKILYFLGASSDTIVFARHYVTVVVIIGNLPAVLSQVLSHLLRNTGYSKQASLGLSMGGVINIILDPLFMFVILPNGYQVLGAAIATTLSNTFSMVYFFVVMQQTKKETGLSANIKDISIDKQDATEIFKVGIPSAITGVLMDLCNMFLNASMASHGDLALAALGIESKIERLSNCICIGLSQAMLPLVAFNYSSKNYKRMNAFINRTRLIGLCVAFCSIAFYQLTAGTLIRTFISTKSATTDVATTITLGILFLRIRSISAPFGMLNFISTNAFQAMGDGKLALIHSLIRQVVLYFPIMYLLNYLFAEVGLVIALPASEMIGATVAVILLQRKLKKLKNG